MDVWQGDQRRKLLQEFERREPNPRGAVGPRMRESIDEIAVGVFLETFQGHGPAGRIADEAFQLITPVCRDVGVGVQRKPLDAGTVGTCQRGHLTLVAKACANAPDLLAGPLPKSDALLHRGRQGARELRRVVEQGVIPSGHGGVHPGLQIPQPTQLTDDPVPDLLEDCGDVRIAGWFGCDKAGLAAHCGAIEVDPLYEDAMAMEVYIDRTAKPLDKRHRPRLDLVAWDTAGDRLVHVILPDGRANNGMDLRREVL